MYMFHSCPSEVGPLKQLTFESISYHIIDGSLEIEILDNNKLSVTLSSKKDGTGGISSYRMNPSDFRIIKSISEFCIFLEVNNGPFKDEDTIWLKN